MKLIDLYEQSIAHHLEFREEVWIVPESMPILYFGDLEAFSRSKLKIVTVGLNPSNAEFMENRFKISNFNTCTPNQIEQSLCQYFKYRPYSRWFDQAFEKLLQPLGASYYGQSYPGKMPSWWSAQPNVVLHTDIGTPLATNPTWSKLPSDAKRRLQATGFRLWCDLIQSLAPNLILISVAQQHLRLLEGSSWQQFPLRGPSGAELELRVSEFKKSKIVWGRAQVRPFFFARSEHRPLIADAILKELRLNGD